MGICTYCNILTEWDICTRIKCGYIESIGRKKHQICRRCSEYYGFEPDSVLCKKHYIETYGDVPVKIIEYNSLFEEVE